jgi:hypothetical protein
MYKIFIEHGNLYSVFRIGISYNADPPYRIQQFRSIRTRIQIQGFDDQKFNKFTVDLLIPRRQIRTSKLKEKPSALNREHPALQSMKLLNFFEFSILWHFCPFRSEPGSSRPKPERIHADPDPEHCLYGTYHTYY